LEGLLGFFMPTAQLLAVGVARWRGWDSNSRDWRRDSHVLDYRDGAALGEVFRRESGFTPAGSKSIHMPANAGQAPARGRLSVSFGLAGRSRYPGALKSALAGLAG
jgi:hypothetical protein